jgi:hypothetical protein
LPWCRPAPRRQRALRGPRGRPAGRLLRAAAAGGLNSAGRGQAAEPIRRNRLRRFRCKKPARAHLVSMHVRVLHRHRNLAHCIQTEHSRTYGSRLATMQSTAGTRHAMDRIPLHACESPLILGEGASMHTAPLISIATNSKRPLLPVISGASDIFVSPAKIDYQKPRTHSHPIQNSHCAMKYP